MKKYLTTLLVTSLLTSTLTSYCQITIKKEIIDKPILKPLAFDSSHNIRAQRRVIDYYQYVGQKIYFIPLSSKYKLGNGFNNKNEEKIDYLKATKFVTIHKPGYKPFDSSLVGTTLIMTYGDRVRTDKRVSDEFLKEKNRYEESQFTKTDVYAPVFHIERKDNYDVNGFFSTNIDSISGKYFTILDIEGKSWSSSDFISLKEFDSESKCRELKVLLRKDNSNDTIIWIVDQPEFIRGFPFLLVPYFSKQKTTYEGKKIVAQKDIEDLVEIQTGKQIKISKGEVLLCTEVTLVELRKERYLKPSFILKNKDNDEVSIPFQLFFESDFITKEQFDEAVRIQKLQEVEREKERRISMQRQKQESAKYLADCINKYGQELGQLIYEGKVSLGMNKQMCLSAWGQPMEIYRTTVNGLSHEQWQYSWKHYLYFDNGLLTAIQN